MPSTRHRTFRIPDDIYDPAQQRAEREGTTVTAVVQECLRRYGQGGGRVMASALPTRERVQRLDRCNRYDDGPPGEGLMFPLTWEHVDPWPWWCVYGDPCHPSELTDDGQTRVLWATCSHPIDLTDGAAERHCAAYQERTRQRDEEAHARHVGAGVFEGFVQDAERLAARQWYGQGEEDE